MKEQPRTKVAHFRNRNYKYKMNTANSAKTCVQKILRARNCRRKFIKNLLPEKRKENV